MTERDERTGFMVSACRRCLAGVLTRVGAGRAALRRALVLAVLLSVAINVVVWLVASSFLEEQASRNALLKSRLNELDQQIVRIRDIREKTSALFAQAGLVEKLLAGNDRVLLDLQILGIAADQDSAGRRTAMPVRFSDLEISRKGLVLRGEAESPASISEILRRLQAFDYQDPRLLQVVRFDQPLPGLHGRYGFIIETGGRVDTPVSVTPGTAAASGSAASLPMPPMSEEPQDSDTLILASVAGIAVVLAALLFRLRRRIAGLFCPEGRSRSAAHRGLSSIDAALVRLQSIDSANPDSWPPALRMLVVVEIFLLVGLTTFSLAVADTLDEFEAETRAEIALRDAYLAKRVFSADVEKRDIAFFEEAEHLFRADLARIPAAFDDVGLLAVFERISGEHKVSLSRLQKEGSERLQETHATQAWSVHLSGSFSALGSVLEEIGHIEPLVSLTAVRLRPLAQAQDELLLEGVFETQRRLSAAELASLKSREKGKK